MLSPKDIEKINFQNEIAKYEKIIDSSIIANHTCYGTHENATINEKLSDDTCDTIARAYISVGWRYVYYKNTSKTQFIFSMHELSLYNSDENFKRHRCY